MTIVRPSHTYSESYIPFPYGKPDFTVAQRILDGRAIILPGDGQSLWTLTHATDFAIGFVGLFGNPYAIGETFHITSDFVYTWDVIAGLVGETLGAAPRIVHLPSEFIASINPGIGDGLLGDKCYSMIFDNTKIKRAVPEYRATIPFHEGIRRCVAWFMEDKNRRIIDRDLDSALDEIIASWNE
jgi:nucleoside-diphosphate-sugar epimerase